MYDKIDFDTIKEIMSEINLSIDDLKCGPTCFMIEKKQFFIDIKKDKLIVTQAKKLFAKKYKFDLSEFSRD